MSTEATGGVQFAVISGASSGDNELVAAVAGRKIRVVGYMVMAAAAVGLKFQSAATDITGLMSFPAAGGAVNCWIPVGCFETAAGEALDMNLDSAVQVSGHLSYQEIK